MTDGTAGDARGRSIRVAAGCMVVIVLIAIGRLVVGGWDGLSADHARYVFAGMSRRALLGILQMV